MPADASTVEPAEPDDAAPARRPLDNDRILDAAAALIELEGAPAFSMRRLATSLGVTPMALYKWFDNREALLDALATRVFDSMTLPDPTEGPWEQRMLDVAIGLRSGFGRSRSVLPLISDHQQLDMIMARTSDRILELLGEIGCTGTDAVDRFRAFFWSVIGFVFAVDANPSGPSTRVNEQLSAAVEALGPDRVPTLAAALPSFVPVDHDELFLFTMSILIDGIASSRSPR